MTGMFMDHLHHLLFLGSLLGFPKIKIIVSVNRTIIFVIKYFYSISPFFKGAWLLWPRHFSFLWPYFSGVRGKKRNYGFATVSLSLQESQQPSLQLHDFRKKGKCLKTSSGKSFSPLIFYHHAFCFIKNRGKSSSSRRSLFRLLFSYSSPWISAFPLDQKKRIGRAKEHCENNKHLLLFFPSLIKPMRGHIQSLSEPSLYKREKQSLGQEQKIILDARKTSFFLEINFLLQVKEKKRNFFLRNQGPLKGQIEKKKVARAY